MKDIEGVFELPGDHPEIIDAVRHGSLIKSGSEPCSGRIEGFELAIRTAHEAVRHNVAIGIKADRRAFIIVGKCVGTQLTRDRRVEFNQLAWVRR